MPPRESNAVYSRAIDKALDLPVVSDYWSEVAKITAPIAPYLEEGIKIIKDKADESLSEAIKDKVGSCVTSLDTLACDGLDQLTSAVPSLRSPTPDLVETTKETANNYVDMIEEYVASFGLAQFGIRLVDTGLAVLESPLSLISTSICSKVQDVRRHLRAVRRAGAKRAGYPCKEGPFLLQVANMFSLNFMLGFLGIQLVGADEEPLASSAKKESSSGLLDKELEEEDSEMDPDCVLDSEESDDSLEYRYLKNKMTEIKLKELEEAFQLFSVSRDGLITGGEIKQLIESVGGKMTEGEARALVRQADRDGDGAIDFSEFSRLWSDIRGEGEEEVEIREEFFRMDSDNSGFITRDEMLSIILGCTHFTSDKVEEAKKCVADLDVDQDGRVSYPEFLLVWKYRM